MAAREAPKSIRVGRLSPSIRILAGLMSRCRKPASCTCARPSSSGGSRRSITGGGSGPRKMRLSSVSPAATAYMVMALAAGETLDNRILRGPLPPPVIDRLLPPLLEGLAHVHEAGFLHRDIKPANILIDGESRPTLIDFGASRAAI